MAGVNYCLSAIGAGSSAATINQQVNAANDQMEGVSNVVATVPLENFGPSDGHWCADTVCFEAIENANQICAIFIHTCSHDSPAASGAILDWQSPVQGHSCPDGFICIDLTCFKIRTECTPPDPAPPVCVDPCVECLKWQNKMDEYACRLPGSSSRSGKSSSVAFNDAQYKRMEERFCYYLDLCNKKSCAKPASNVMPYYTRPPC